MADFYNIAFDPGQQVLLRTFRSNGRLIAIESARVVENGTLAWMGPGMPCVIREAADGRRLHGAAPAELAAVKTTLSHYEFRFNTLSLTPPEADHSVMWFFNPEGRFDRWYINLQRPAAWWRDGTASGVDIVDQTLDVLVEPDRTWRWKDEQSFTARTGHPPFHTAAEAEAIRAAGRRLIGEAVAGRFPFDGTWCDFRPDPSWTPLPLPDGWDRPAAWKPAAEHDA